MNCWSLVIWMPTWYINKCVWGHTVPGHYSTVTENDNWYWLLLSCSPMVIMATGSRFQRHGINPHTWISNYGFTKMALNHIPANLLSIIQSYRASVFRYFRGAKASANTETIDFSSLTSFLASMLQQLREDSNTTLAFRTNSPFWIINQRMMLISARQEFQEIFNWTDIKFWCAPPQFRNAVWRQQNRTIECWIWWTEQ